MQGHDWYGLSQHPSVAVINGASVRPGKADMNFCFAAAFSGSQLKGFCPDKRKTRTGEAPAKISRICAVAGIVQGRSGRPDE